MTNKDITDRKDIELLVDAFYAKARVDETIGPVFNTVIGDNWNHHLPVIYQFWETIILGTPGYNGNPVRKHIEIDKKQPLNGSHYKRWLELWHETVDGLYTGANATEIKKRATLMMNLVSIKVEDSRKGQSLL